MRVLVPVDGSGPAQRAVAHAIALIRDPAADEIVLLNVQSAETLDVSDVSGVISAASDRERAAARFHEILGEAEQLCRNAGIRCRSDAALGPIAETIVQRAAELAADQIVIGSRGLGTLERLVLGSVALAVAAAAKVPVTIVK